MDTNDVTDISPAMEMLEEGKRDENAEQMEDTLVIVGPTVSSVFDRANLKKMKIWDLYFITKTCLFKYTEKLITKKLNFFRQKIQIFFIFLLKT